MFGSAVRTPLNADLRITVEHTELGRAGDSNMKSSSGSNVHFVAGRKGFHEPCVQGKARTESGFANLSCCARCRVFDLCQSGWGDVDHIVSLSLSDDESPAS